MSEWIGVLTISSKYFIKKGVQEVVEKLRKPPDDIPLDPYYKLRVAWEFGLDNLYDEILNEVFLPPLESQGEDFRGLEGSVSTLIV